MNTAIRPALPILYSFFFRDQKITGFQYFSVRFIYFYYFLLTIFALYYFLKKYTRYNLIGVLAFISCYYTLIFGPIFNAKEIILSFLSFSALMLINEIKAIDRETKIKYPALIGILIGLGILINLSGIIIGGILFLLLIKKVGLKKKAWPIIITAGILLLAFSGSEMKNVFTFIFNKNLISNHSTMTTFKSPELTHYGINYSKLDILLKGKLQGFTQIQFYGLLFIIFLITLFRVAKKRSLDHISKNVLLYMGLFFLIVMDPFFLNPQKYAYVLSISPKYTVLLTIFSAFFIAYNFDTLINFRDNRFSRQMLKVFGYFLFIVSIISLINPIRSLFIEIIYSFIAKFIPLHNNTAYYMSFLNHLILTTTILCITILTSVYIFTKYTKTKISLSSIASVAIIFSLIFPDLFIINSNYNIYNTFAYAFSQNEAKKINAADNSPQAKQLYDIINYINSNIEKNAKIIVALKSGTTSYSNAWYYIENNQRLVDSNNNITQDFKNANYFLISKEKIPYFNLEQNYSRVLSSPEFILYKLN